MSYINFTYASRTHDPAAPHGVRDEQVDVGYCREGGRVDALSERATDPVTGEIHCSTVLPNDAVLDAADGLKNVLSGASWVSNLTVDRSAAGTPVQVSWQTRERNNGFASGTTIPVDVARVLAAAERLERAVASAGHVPFRGD